MADWQPGDLALCVSSGVTTRAGKIYVVSDVIAPETKRTEGLYTFLSRSLLLRFEGLRVVPGQASSASRFRKITPGTEPEGIEEPRRVPVKEVQHG